MKENRSKTKNYTKYSYVYSDNIDMKKHTPRENGEERGKSA